MGRVSNVFAFVLGLLGIGSGLFLLSAVCFLYLFVSFVPKRSNRFHRGIPQPSRVVAGIFLAVSIAAFASGGTYSPLVFLLGAMFFALLPRISSVSFFSSVVPVHDSILLRSRVVPFRWYGVAEIKAGSEEVPRALSSFQGNLVLMKKRARVYSCVSVFALDSTSAENAVLIKLKEAAVSLSPSRAFVLPLDSGSSSDLMRLKFRRRHSEGDPFKDTLADTFVLDTVGPFVAKVSAFVTEASRDSHAPSAGSKLKQSPLTWEAMESIGRSLRWPEPDNFSDVLGSLASTPDVQISDRLLSLNHSGPDMTVQGLGGAEVNMTGPQLRSLVSIYS